MTKREQFYQNRATPTTFHEWVVRAYDIYAKGAPKRGERGRRKWLAELVERQRKEFLRPCLHDYRMEYKFLHDKQHSINPPRHFDWRKVPAWDKIGSGRAAHWLNLSFEHLSVIARTVHAQTGLRDAVCRDVARKLHHELYSGVSTYERKEFVWDLLPSVLPKIPKLAAWLRYSSLDDDFAAKQAKTLSGIWWYMFAHRNVPRAIGEYNAAKRLKRLELEPSFRINGYLADSIMKWKGNEGSTDYSGCSGSEAYVIHREHPETWDYLLSRAPVGESGENWEQVFPHEHERAKALKEAGWRETLRMSDSVFTRELPMGLNTVDSLKGKPKVRAIH